MSVANAILMTVYVIDVVGTTAVAMWVTIVLTRLSSRQDDE